MVQVIIMLVNGNIGAGVAVAGAFSLVRFRSAPGSAREIALVFLAMALGLATGMGYVALAGLFFLIMALFGLVLTALRFGEAQRQRAGAAHHHRGNLDYDGLFDDLFEKYTYSTELERVKPPTWAPSTSCGTASSSGPPGHQGLHGRAAAAATAT